MELDFSARMARDYQPISQFHPLYEIASVDFPYALVCPVELKHVDLFQCADQQFVLIFSDCEIVWVSWRRDGLEEQEAIA